jgi:diguanylate cyclase (GGDEF)-like protein/PAS domain S-box-containing protein
VTSLRSRIIIIVLLASIPMVGLIIYNDLQSRRQSTQNYQRELQILIKDGENDYQDAITQTRQFLGAIAHFPAVSQRQAEACAALFAALLKEGPLYANILALTPDGELIASGLPPKGSVNFSHRKYYQLAMQTKQFTVGEMVIGQMVGKPVLHCAYPILDSAGEVQAIVIAALNIDHLAKSMPFSIMPKGSTVTIINSQGKVIFRQPDPNHWAEKDVAETEIVKVIRTQGQGMAKARGSDGIPRLYAFMPMGWTYPKGFIYAGIPLETVFAATNQTLIRNISTLLVALVFILIMAWVLGYLCIVRRMGALTAATRQLAAGDLSARTGLTYGTGEIDCLARSFDHLAETLQQREIQRQQAEEDLKLKERLLDNAGDSIFLHDLNGNFIYVNQVACASRGYEHDELMGKDISLILHPGFAGTRERLLKDLLAKGELIFESAHICRDASVMPVEIHARLFNLDHRTLILSVVRDITQRKQNQQALQQANTQLQAMVQEGNRRNGELTTINSMSEKLQSCLASEEAYPIIIQHVQILFPAKAGALFILDHDNQLVEAVSTWGEPLAGKLTFSPDDCWALRWGRLHFAKDSSLGMTCRHVTPTFNGNYLCLPLLGQDETMGLLHVQDLQGLAGEQLEAPTHLAVTVADHISLALANIRLRETLRYQVIHDPLTELFNRRYLGETLAREIHRVKRKDAPLGVFMLDLDHFKRFNDTFGHEAGDNLLRALGQFLQVHIRQEDVACRYGGEEFVLILPEAPRDVLLNRAELIRQSVPNLQIYQRGLVLEGTTVSIGVAIFPEHGATGEELLRAADDALYRAKAAGRNRVMVADTEFDKEMPTGSEIKL